MIKWIFFDLDGVLVDSRQWHVNAFKEGLIQEGIKLTDKDHEALDGLSTRSKLEILTRTHHLTSSQVEAILAKKQQVTLELLAKHLIPNDTLISLLTEIKRIGIKIGLCSNAVRETVNICLKGMKIEHFFEFSLSNQDVMSPKPSPEIYLKALKLANVSSNEVLVVEDSPHGVVAAKESGCNLLIVKNAQDLTWDKLVTYLKIPA